jgi:hypothetical protein
MAVLLCWVLLMFSVIYAEYRKQALYADSCILFFVVLNVIMLSVIMWNVVMLSVVVPLQCIIQ